MYATDPRLASNQQILKLVTDLRGGSLGTLGAVALFGVMILVFSIGEGFVPPGWGFPVGNDGWLAGTGDRYRPSPSGTSREITRPSTMPHQEFVDLTPQERRNLPHANDKRITHEGRPELVVGFWQAKEKVGDHGAVHNLPYTLKAKSRTKTVKSDENTLQMMESLVDMPNRNNIKWIEDGTYQGNTDREFAAIHVYDVDQRIIAVYNKERLSHF